MREKTCGADLVRHAATRFATSFLTLKSLHKHKDALKALFHSEEWSENKLAKTNAGDNVHSIVSLLSFGIQLKIALELQLHSLLFLGWLMVMRSLQCQRSQH